MDYQILFNIAIAIVSTIAGWVFHIMYNSMRELQKADFRLSEEIYKVSLVIAGDYVKKDDLNRIENNLYEKIDKLDSKLEEKTKRLEDKIDAQIV